MAVNEISAQGPRIFTGTFLFDARLDLNIIFLREVTINW